jgi:hypothetical protein
LSCTYCQRFDNIVIAFSTEKGQKMRLMISRLPIFTSVRTVPDTVVVRVMMLPAG